jgi:hypothetical protein
MAQVHCKTYCILKLQQPVYYKIELTNQTQHAKKRLTLAVNWLKQPLIASNGG